MTDKTKDDNRVEGEGSYSGTKAYNERTAAFVRKGKVDKAATAAKEALESDEAADLARAEEEGRAGDPRGLGDKAKP